MTPCALVTHITYDYTTYVFSKYCVLTKRVSSHFFIEKESKILSKITKVEVINYGTLENLHNIWILEDYHDIWISEHVYICNLQNWLDRDYPIVDHI